MRDVDVAIARRRRCGSRMGWAMDKVRCYNRLVEALGTAVRQKATDERGIEVRDARFSKAAKGGGRLVRVAVKKGGAWCSAMQSHMAASRVGRQLTGQATSSTSMSA